MENYTEKQIQRTNILSIVPLRGKVAFPDTLTSFEVGREITLKAIDRATASADRLLFICAQRETEKDEITADDIYSVGTVARIKQVTQLPGGTLRILTEGLYRARARSVQFESGYYYAVTDEILSEHGDEVLEEAYFRTAREMVRDVLMADGKIGKDILSQLEACSDPDTYINMTVSAMRVRLEIKQELLEEESVIERLKLFERCLNDELEIAKIEKKIASAVRQNIDRSQKDYFLREQLKAIHTELGDDGKEEDEYREKILAKKLPEEVEEKCLKELDRLDKMQSSSPEYTVITGYLDWILDLPWTEETKDTEKLSDCVKVLDADHYGLEKIKERITEYLAVLKLTGNMKAPILCFVGPPGVGKTSIARSIARSLDRKFVRMSLGGVKDEAEIRGHRRTYIGAMPGRIIQAIKQAGTRNPVIVLDEVDKLGSDFRGDPSSALLEVLDPEQNHTFSDHYLNVPFDLSKVMFLCTANHLETIPAPLRDRMEVISLPGYTMQEKVEIAKRHLLPKKVTENGLREGDVIMDDTALTAVIRGYTREAGLRNLERELGSICRKLARQRAEGKKGSFTVDSAMVEKLLGAPRFIEDEKDKRLMPGMALGLAWTPAGGEVLTIECACMKGKGNLQLTGQLGDVMKESARIAMSYIRSRADSLGIDADFSDTQDIHIHVPAGAVPKDGPSAGVTLTSALISALSGRIVRADTCMTGEITLQGRVLPVGGIKEKILAGVARGLKHVIIPSQNVKDLEEVPKELLKKIKVHPAHTYDDVLALAFEPVKKTAARAKKAAPATEKK